MAKKHDKKLEKKSEQIENKEGEPEVIAEKPLPKSDVQEISKHPKFDKFKEGNK